jgi:hypothetical protein
MLSPRLARLLVCCALALAPGAGRAQPWAGPVGLGIEVSDRGGRPVAAASVVLAFLGTPGNGPQVETGADGRAEIVGLAEGLWVASVRHSQFLGFDAQVRLTADRRPYEEKAFQVKVTDSTERLKIRFYPVAGLSRAAAPAAAPEPDRAARRAEEDATRRDRAETARARRAERSTEKASREPDRPALAPVATPTPPTRSPTAAAAPAPTVAPLPAPAATPAVPEAPSPAASDPPVAPAAERAAPAAPAPTSAPAAPEPPQRFVRASRDGSCIECRPNEWAVTAAGEARPAGPPDCPTSLRSLVAALAQRVAALAASPELDRAAGPLLAAPGMATVAGDQSNAAADYAVGGCQVLAVKLPRGAGFQGFQLEVEGAAGVLPCIPDQDCPGGAGRWATLPVVEDSPAGKVIGAAFRHAGTASSARPRLTVYFLPPSSWSP